MAQETHNQMRADREDCLCERDICQEIIRREGKVTLRVLWKHKDSDDFDVKSGYTV